MGFDEILTLFRARGREVAAVAQVADELRQEIVGDAVTWVANRNINYTNVHVQVPLLRLSKAAVAQPPRHPLSARTRRHR